MKKRAYIMAFSSRRDRDEIKDFLNSRSDIHDWYICFRNAVFLLATSSADELAEAYHERFPDAPRVFIAHVDEDRQGWMPSRGWKLLHEAESSDEELS
jgi:hypothetical protein